MYHGEVNIAQDELNSFLTVAEDLKVKGLTQNKKADHAPKQTPDMFVPPTKVLAPPETLKQMPSVSKSVCENPNLQSIQNTITAGYNDDDIQEVLPVKSEPITQLEERGATGEDNSVNHIVVDDSMEMYEESYNDYDNYGDDSETGYDMSMITVGNSNANKGTMCLSTIN